MIKSSGKRKFQPNQPSLQVMSLWLNNELYEVTEANMEILKSRDGWLNNNFMDAGKKLISKAVGSLETYQSVLNCQKKSTYFPVSGDYLQLLRDGSCNWLFAFTSSGRVQACDSLCTNLTSIWKIVLKCFDSASQCLVECPNLSQEDPKHVDPEFASPLRNGRKKKKKNYQSISGTPA